MSVYKRPGLKSARWYYYFRIRGLRYRGALPEARTKWQAEQAESKIKQEVFEKRYGKSEPGTEKLSDFIEKVFLPWSKTNKRSWKDDIYTGRVLCEYFGGKTFREISPILIEKFKSDRRKSITKKGTPRCPATVNRELVVLSKIINLAIDYKKADFNPCSKVKKFRLDNRRFRYLLPEEEPALMNVLTGPRAHLKPIVAVALGTGMRRGEQLSLRRNQVDFSRNIVMARKTKSGKDRDIPMNSEVRNILFELCKGKTGEEYVFVNPKTDTRIKEVKKGFGAALRLAGIEGLVWHDLRATFGTRLGEAGYDAFTIADLMGHTDIRMTARYVRATERNKRAAVDAAMLRSQQVVHRLATKEKRQAGGLAVNS
ncbi:MAG: site-specific integrase [Acidobacteriota bacterium]|nr:site-specific integrase [Acidobacteriota bacterium]